MRRRVLEAFGVAAAVVGVIALLQLAPVPVEGQAQQPTDPSDAEPATPTPWGEPDLQGIWTTDYLIPLERPARFADQEFLTDEQRAELDQERARIIYQDTRYADRGSEQDVGGRLQRRDLPVAQVHGPADVADHRSAQRPDSAADARGAGAARRHPRVPARAAAGHRGLPRQPALLRGRPVTGRRRRAGTSRRRSIRRRAPRRAGRSTAPTARKIAASASAACRPGCPTSGARPAISCRSCSRPRPCRSSTTPARGRAGSGSSR